jgi:SAM-dependent methyltransferase
MGIDTDRIENTVRHFSACDPLEAYYEMNSLQRAARGAVVADAGDVLRSCMRTAGRVLDVGCGNGWRLLESHHLFERGVGVDDSDYALAQAREQAGRRGIANTEFISAKAITLPFEDASFGFVYSERGPLGYFDPNLQEALRVLRPGGSLFVETLGSLNTVEVKESFEGFDASRETLLTSLEGERRRFERVGFQISLLAAMRRSMVFEDLYKWFSWQCSIWRYLGSPQPWPSTEGRLASFAEKHAGPGGVIPITYHTIWIGGIRPT